MWLIHKVCFVIQLFALIWSFTVVKATSTNTILIRPLKKFPSLSNSHILINVLRGGGLSLDDSDEDSEEHESSDDEDSDDEDFGTMYDLDDAEDDFVEETTISRTLLAWGKTPPLTKTYLTASFAASLYGYLINKNEFPPILTMNWKKTFSRLQLWRPVTAFLNVGPFGLAYVMTAHFVWTYMSTLERLNHDRPYDFWIMIAFGCISMVTGYGILKVSPKYLGHNLSTYLVYIWSRYHEGLEVNLFELFNTRAELLPWFFLAQTFLLEGEVPFLDFLGIAFGHIYHHCKTVGILSAPDALVEWYNGDSAAGIRDEYKKLSADFEI
mmetsp:Transcript_22629/g.34180  ORF Transcript_22629/g.34180 Transcript_22629/m.34180 type:complete len:325 (+) Transcript_22629:118-1092(+)